MVFLNVSQSLKIKKKTSSSPYDFLVDLFSSGLNLEKVSRVREACHISHITSQ